MSNTHFGVVDAAPGLGWDNGLNYRENGEYLIWGQNLAVSSGNVEGVWHLTTPFDFPPLGGTTVEVLSNNAQDSAAGTGARTVQVVGLNTSLLYQTATITMDGVNPVAVPGTWSWIQWMQVMTFGGFGSNIAQVRIRDSVTLVNYDQMLRGDNRTSSCKFMVPADKSAFIRGWNGELNLETLDPVTTDLDRRFWLMSNANQFTGGTLTGQVNGLMDIAVLGQNADFSRTFSSPRRLQGGTMIFVNIENNTGGSVRATAGINIELDDAGKFIPLE